jgi:hypothetical protein
MPSLQISTSEQHAPPVQYWPLAHDVAVLHSPVEPHVSTPVPPSKPVPDALPTHWVAPGRQTPAQAPPTQTYGQATGLPNVPAELQVSTPLPEHWVAPGVHAPAQVPLLQT